VEISLEAPVAQVLVDGGKARGVRLESGEEIAAPSSPPMSARRCSIARWSMPAISTTDFKKRIKGFKTGSGTFRMNVALSELPDFTRAAGQGSRPSTTPPGSSSRPGMDYMDQAFIDAQQRSAGRRSRSSRSRFRHRR
jgi:phytoene dehydrogenase-like protein